MTKLTFLGVGSAFTLKNWQSNMLAESGGKRLLIDCGGDCRYSLAERGLGAKDIDERQTVYRSARNIKGVAVSLAAEFNAYAVLRPKRLVLTKAAVNDLCKSAKWGPAPKA